MYSWETEVVKQQLYNQIKDAMYANTVGRQLVDVIPLKAGHSLNMPIEDKNSLKMRFVSEGATFVTDVEAYTNKEIIPVKYGVNVSMTQEMKEDANWNLLQRNLRSAGRQAGLTEDFLIFTAFNSSSTGFPSVGAQAITSGGTEMSVADIANMMKAIENEDYEANALVIHPTQTAELRQIDTFVEADKVGSDIAFQRGFVGKIFGMDVVKTTKAWVDQTTTQYAWALDTREAGVLVVRRPLTVRPYEVPAQDKVCAAVSFRSEAQVIRPQAGCRLTIS